MGLQRVYDKISKKYFHVIKLYPLPGDQLDNMQKLKSKYLNHCVNIIDLKLGKYHYILMDLLEGNQLTYQKQRSEQDLTKLIVQGSQAISELHQIKIPHQNIRPENFIITNNNQQKDLYLSFYSQPKKQQELNEYEACYMSPEELDGTIADKFASDVWHLGAVIFEMASGKPLYKYDKKNSIIDESYIQSQILSINIPNAIKQMLVKILNVDPKKRLNIETIQQFLIIPPLTKIIQLKSNEKLGCVKDQIKQNTTDNEKQKIKKIIPLIKIKQNSTSCPLIIPNPIKNQTNPIQNQLNPIQSRLNPIQIKPISIKDISYAFSNNQT